MAQSMEHTKVCAVQYPLLIQRRIQKNVLGGTRTALRVLKRGVRRRNPWKKFGHFRRKCSQNSFELTSSWPCEAAATNACWTASDSSTSRCCESTTQSQESRYARIFKGPFLAACTKAHLEIKRRQYKTDATKKYHVIIPHSHLPAVSTRPKIAPAAVNCCTTSWCPRVAAMISGVQPWLFARSTFAPNSNSKATISVIPSLANKQRMGACPR